MNPYWGLSFIQFFQLFFQRLGLFLSGDLGISDLASDEIQIAALVLTSVCCALIGTFLILRKMAMLANALSHTILLGIVLSYILLLTVGEKFPSGQEGPVLTLSGLMIASFLSGILTTLLTYLLQRFFRLQEDASIGLVFTSLFALGIILVTLYSRNMHLGTEAVMGNIDAVHQDDLKLLLWVVGIEMLCFALFFKELAASSFDPGFARAIGIPNFGIDLLLMVLVSAACIAAFRVTGVLLVLAFLVVLPLTARLWTHRLKKMIILAALAGAFCGIFAVALARHLLSVQNIALSTSGIAVVLIGLVFSASLGWQAASETLRRKRLVAERKGIVS